jgi:general secretion pathway protein K
MTTACPTVSKRPEQRGIALVAVLWLVALLTVLATASVTITTGRARVARTAIEQEQARLLADSAIRLALVDLASPRTTRSVSDGPREIVVFGQTVRVDIGLESERLNVNTADRSELQQYLEQRNVAEGPAVAARIVDYRDRDSEPLPGGAELAKYRAADLAYSPRNGAFESVEELMQTLNMNGEDPPWNDGVTIYGSARDHASAPNRSFTMGDIMRLNACASTAQGGFCRAAVVRLTGSHKVPLQTFHWK